MFRMMLCCFLALAIAWCGMALIPQVQAVGITDGSVELINKSNAPVVVVIDSGARGEGANVKKFPAQGNKLGLLVGPGGKSDTISNCFKLGDEITVHVYEVKDDQPTREVSSKKFSTVAPDLRDLKSSDLTRNFHLEWDGNTLTKK